MDKRKFQVQQWKMHTFKSGEEKPHAPAHLTGPSVGRKKMDLRVLVDNKLNSEPTISPCSKAAVCPAAGTASQVLQALLLLQIKVNITVFDKSEYIMVFKCIKLL